jgi:hypothetical protein
MNPSDTGVFEVHIGLGQASGIYSEPSQSQLTEQNAVIGHRQLKAIRCEAQWSLHMIPYCNINEPYILAKQKASKC